MEQLCLPFPILPGRGQVARAFLHELEASRKAEHALAASRLSLTRALWFITDGAGSEQLVAFLEGPDVRQALDRLVHSRDPFDRWFKEGLAAATGLDLSDPPEGMALPELLASYTADEASTSSDTA